MDDILYKSECYKIIGLCMDVHKTLGNGFSEVVYKDALEIEFIDAGIPYKREHDYKIEYKGRILQHVFYADFLVYENIIIEVKCKKAIIDEHISQTLNYLAAANVPLGLIINFGENSLKYKRLIYTKRTEYTEQTIKF